MVELVLRDSEGAINSDAILYTKGSLSDEDRPSVLIKIQQDGVIVSLWVQDLTTLEGLHSTLSDAYYSLKEDVWYAG